MGLVRRVVGLVLVVVAAGGVVNFGSSRAVGVGPAVVAAPLPAPIALPLPADSARPLVYQRGLEPRSAQRTLVERWVLPGSAFRERVTVDGHLFSDRSDGHAVDYVRGTWRPGPVAGPVDDCARNATQVARGLADGTITVSGDGIVLGGHPTTVLRDHGKPVVDLWVIAGTHQVVRCRGIERAAITFDLVWLPATEPNVAQLRAVIPDGFVTDRARTAT